MSNEETDASGVSTEKTSAPPRVTIFCDGGSRPNPGNGAWAAILRFGAKEKEISALKTTYDSMEKNSTALRTKLRWVQGLHDSVRERQSYVFVCV